MEAMELIGVWIGIALTLGLYSFLYKDNPVFKFCEHVFVGVGTGYMLIYLAIEVVWPKLLLPLLHLFQWDVVPRLGRVLGKTWNAPSTPLEDGETWWLIVPTFFSLFMLVRFVPKLVWLSRWSFAFIVGYTAGNSIYASAQGQLFPQAQATLEPLWNPDGAWGMSLNAVIVLAGVLSVLIYFFFSIEHKGGTPGLARSRYYLLGVGGLTALAAIWVSKSHPEPEWDRARGAMIIASLLSILIGFVVCREKHGGIYAISRLGIFFLMIAFGAAFGYTVMARESLLIGRVMELERCARQPAGFATLILLPIIVGLIAFLETRRPKNPPTQA